MSDSDSDGLVVVSVGGYEKGRVFHDLPEDVDPTPLEEYDTVDVSKCQYGDMSGASEWFVVSRTTLLEERPEIDYCDACNPDATTSPVGGMGKMGKDLLDMDPGDLPNGSADAREVSD